MNRQLWDLATTGSGLEGRKKRHFFNQLSGYAVLWAGLAAAYLGYSYLGCVGACIGFVLAVALIGKFLVKGRFFR